MDDHIVETDAFRNLIAMAEFTAKPPAEIETGANSDAGPIYELIREDIISGRLKANERLVVADLAKRHGTSTNPVREALQLLRGEGFVILSPNRGARVRPIDQDFIRDISEIAGLIEPFLTRWFVGMATDEDVAELERIQGLIEENDFKDTAYHAELDTTFHTRMYERHYNRHAAELWWKNREVLRAMGRRMGYTLSRRAAVIRDHRELIQCIKNQDANQASVIIERHVLESGHYVIEQMRTNKFALGTKNQPRPDAVADLP